MLEKTEPMFDLTRLGHWHKVAAGLGLPSTSSG